MDADTLAKRAASFLDIGKFGRALQDCNAAIELNGKSLSAYLTRAHVNLEMEKYAETEQDCTTVLQWDYNNEKALLLRAQALMNMDQHLKAVQDATNAVRGNANCSKGLLLRAESQLALMRADEALRDCSQILQNDSRNVEALTVRSQVYLAMGKFEDVVRDCNGILSAESNNSNAYRRRAAALNALKRHTEAMQDSLTAMSLHCSELSAFTSRTAQVTGGDAVNMIPNTTTQLPFMSPAIRPVSMADGEAYDYALYAESSPTKQRPRTSAPTTSPSMSFGMNSIVDSPAHPTSPIGFAPPPKSQHSTNESTAPTREDPFAEIAKWSGSGNTYISPFASYTPKRVGTASPRAGTSFNLSTSDMDNILGGTGMGGGALNTPNAKTGIRGISGLESLQTTSFDFKSTTEQPSSQLEDGAYPFEVNVSGNNNVLGAIGSSGKTPSSISSINMSNCGLTDGKLGEILQGLPSLTVLDVSENKLDVLTSICGCKAAPNLKILNASDNPVKAIPSNVNVLQSLEKLELYKAKVTELPPALFELTNLKELNIYNNSCVKIPEQFNKLQGLQNVNLGGNKLMTLPPAAVKGMHNVLSFSVFMNRIIKLPPLKDFSKIEILHLHTNKLVELPEFGMHPHLKELKLSKNELKNLPLSISRDNMPSLECLEIADNKLTTIPPKIGSLDNLKKLDLSDNNLQDLPDGIFRLPSLVSLNLQRNHFAVLPGTISELRDSLNILLLSDNVELDSLPPAVTSLSLLNRVSLKNTAVAGKGSSELTSLKALVDGNRGTWIV